MRITFNKKYKVYTQGKGKWNFQRFPPVLFRELWPNKKTDWISIQSLPSRHKTTLLRVKTVKRRYGNVVLTSCTGFR